MLKIILIGMLALLSGVVNAQSTVTVNIGTPPQWGPAGYTGAQYYYLPDVEAYYDVESSVFIYQSGGDWIYKTYLPRRYRNYDLFKGYKVTLTENSGNTPYLNYKAHKAKYAKGYHGQLQKNIGEQPIKGNFLSRIL